MRFNLATTCFVLGIVLAPVAACAKDSNADRSSPTIFVKDSVITTKIKSQLAAEHAGSMQHISVDTDSNGVVWMSGTASNQGEIDKAVAIARNTEGVKWVKNDLKVQKNR
jgi:hyperosmotically inducible periplasmic protein